MKKALVEAGAQAKVVAQRLGMLTSAKGSQVHIDYSFLTSSSVLFDAIYIPGGDGSAQALQKEADAIEFVQEAYKHCKTIAATGAGAGAYSLHALDETTWAGPIMKVIRKHRRWVLSSVRRVITAGLPSSSSTRWPSIAIGRESCRFIRSDSWMSSRGVSCVSTGD